MQTQAVRKKAKKEKIDPNLVLLLQTVCIVL